MTVTILVPNDEGLTALKELPDVHLVRYQWGAPWPAGAELADILIPDFLTSGADSTLCAGLPKLRLVQLLTAGVEEWVGRLPSGVLLSSGRGAHGATTAEWVIAALLSIYRELEAFADARRTATWHELPTETLLGKRVLVIGAGDLGEHLRRQLAPFSTRVSMVATTPRKGVHGTEELPSLLGEHDVVALMMPLTPQTQRMVDATFLAAMPDGAILVNAARGQVVDTDALMAELRTGRLRAALDVTDPEPLPADHPLWTMPGVLITPHLAGGAGNPRARAYEVAKVEIARYMAGELPHNLVTGDY